jgi:hypothetical protein
MFLLIILTLHTPTKGGRTPVLWFSSRALRCSRIAPTSFSQRLNRSLKHHKITNTTERTRMLYAIKRHNLTNLRVVFRCRLNMQAWHLSGGSNTALASKSMVKFKSHMLYFRRNFFRLKRVHSRLFKAFKLCYEP